jgi:hypothetical protein
MANPEHLAILKEHKKEGVEAWNEWRKKNFEVFPDFSGADLRKTKLRKADLRRTNLSEADLRSVSLRRANLSRANLRAADLRGADLFGANLSVTDLRGAYLNGADLRESNLSRANLDRTDFTESRVGYTTFADVDLSAVIGLETLVYSGPSSIGIDTIYKSKGKIPHIFLRGCGVPDFFIENMAGLVGTGIEFYSLFISYSTKDQEFAERLHADLQDNGVRCWFAPHEMLPGRKIHSQIDDAIRMYDKLLLILSKASMESEWVRTEIAIARKREIEQKREVLFPVALCPYKTIREWEYFDSDIGKSSAREIREYFIPDFSNWKTNHGTYQAAFSKLLKGLQGKQDSSTI